MWYYCSVTKGTEGKRESHRAQESTRGSRMTRRINRSVNAFINSTGKCEERWMRPSSAPLQTNIGTILHSNTATTFTVQTPHTHTYGWRRWHGAAMVWRWLTTNSLCFFCCNCGVNAIVTDCASRWRHEGVLICFIDHRRRNRSLRYLHEHSPCSNEETSGKYWNEESMRDAEKSPYSNSNRK